MGRPRKIPVEESAKPKFCRVCKDIKEADLFLTTGNKAMLSVCSTCRKGGYIKATPETRLCTYFKCKEPYTTSHPRKRFCSNSCYDKHHYHEKHNEEKDKTEGTVDPKWLTRGRISTNTRCDSMTQ